LVFNSETIFLFKFKIKLNFLSKEETFSFKKEISESFSSIKNSI